MHIKLTTSKTEEVEITDKELSRLAIDFIRRKLNLPKGSRTANGNIVKDVLIGGHNSSWETEILRAVSEVEIAAFIVIEKLNEN